MENYYYGSTPYTTLAEAQTAADEMLTNLQTKPSVWCIVKRVEANPDGSYVIPSETVPDAEALNLPDGVYSVQSIISGENLIGLTAAEATDAISRLRTEFATSSDVSVITMIKVEATNADFSAYLGANQ